MQGFLDHPGRYLTGAGAVARWFMGMAVHRYKRARSGQPLEDGFAGNVANRVDSLHVDGGKDWPHRRLRE
ncbi:hypothetical protein B0E51_18260 [Rhodanobacter sp. C05]|nr:hypothetical protein B0E51_18260 [Rhodanobacter sp. C05]